MNAYKVVFKPFDNEIIMPEGSTIKEAIIKSGVDFDFPCGGIGNCGKCRIKLLEKSLPPTLKEQSYLTEKEFSQGIHLACETKIHDNLTVELQKNDENIHNILQWSVERTSNVDPLINKTYVEVDLPSLEEQKSDLKRLKEKLSLKNSSYQNIKIKFSALKDLPDIIREAQHKITVINDDSEILGIEKGNTSSKILGIAFDIGTTTIVGYLIDLNTGKELSVSSTLNPQVKFGADVISRTTYANQNVDGIKMMQTTLLKAIDKLIGDTLNKASLRREDVYSITVVGNTCMHHIFLGLTPRYIAAIPYVPVISEPINLNASDLNLHINPCGKIFILPTIAGFVGADTVAVILATEMDKNSDIKLAIDIGTNGEIVLGSSKKLVSCSAAAGPAFEGAQISSGMRGAKGAIDHVNFGKSMTYTVIGNGKPEGICGSGLLDIIAGFVELGIINKRGKILSPSEFINPFAKSFEKCIVTYDNAKAFLVVPENGTAHGRPIMITQNDITALQLAKGAISAGINILIDKLGITTCDIKEVLLAGAFGNYMNPHSACAIGLIPKALENKIKMVGNAAGTGSKLALLSKTEYERSNNIASTVKYIELGAQKNFNRSFAKGMQF